MLGSILVLLVHTLGRIHMKNKSDSISAVPVMFMLSAAAAQSTIGAVLTLAMWAAFLLSTRTAQ